MSTSSPVRLSPPSNRAMPTLAVTRPLAPRRRGHHLVAHRREHRLTGEPRLLGAALGHEHGELVAAQPGEHVGLAHAGAQGLGHARDEVVPRRVPERVVDGLEVVEVEHEQRAAGAVAAHERDVAVELALEGAAVEQAGEVVVVGEVAQLGLMAAVVGDVLELDEDVQRPPARVVHDRRRDGDPHEVPVGVDQALLAAVGDRVVVVAPGDRGARLVELVGMDDVGEAAPLELLARQPDEPAQGVVDPLPDPVERAHRHADRRVVEGGAEERLGLGEAALGRHAGGDVAQRGAGRAAVGQEAVRRLDPDRRAVRAEHPVHERQAFLAARQRGEHGLRGVLLIGRHELGDRAPDELVRLVAEQLLRRGRRPRDDAAVERDEHVARRLGHQRGLVLGPALRLLGAVALGHPLGHEAVRVALAARGEDDDGGQQRGEQAAGDGDEQDELGVGRRAADGDRPLAAGEREADALGLAHGGAVGVERAAALLEPERDVGREAVGDRPLEPWHAVGAAEDRHRPCAALAQWDVDGDRGGRHAQPRDRGRGLWAVGEERRVQHRQAQRIGGEVGRDGAHAARAADGGGDHVVRRARPGARHAGALGLDDGHPRPRLEGTAARLGHPDHEGGPAERPLGQQPRREPAEAPLGVLARQAHRQVAQAVQRRLGRGAGGRRRRGRQGVLAGDGVALLVRADAQRRDERAQQGGEHGQGPHQAGGDPPAADRRRAWHHAYIGARRRGL